jgi:hypothetical protein
MYGQYAMVYWNYHLYKQPQMVAGFETPTHLLIHDELEIMANEWKNLWIYLFIF